MLTLLSGREMCPACEWLLSVYKKMYSDRGRDLRGDASVVFQQGHVCPQRIAVTKLGHLVQEKRRQLATADVFTCRVRERVIENEFQLFAGQFKLWRHRRGNKQRTQDPEALLSAKNFRDFAR